MGIFSSKKKTYVATEISPLFEKEDIPTLRKKNIVDSIFNNKSLNNAYINNAMQSLTIKAEKAYRKAARGEYYYGTPSHSNISSLDGKGTLQNILEDTHQSPINFLYYHFTSLNNIHWAWQNLVDDYNYDEFTNTLQINDRTYWVEHIEGVINTDAISSDDPDDEVQERVPDMDTLEIWDREPGKRYTPFRDFDAEPEPYWVFDDSGGEDGSTVYLVDAEGGSEKLFFSTYTFDRDLDCFQAKYTYEKGGQRVTRYFTYELGASEYPKLDSVYNQAAPKNGSFFPVFLFRSKGQKIKKGSAAYRSQEKLASVMDLDYAYMHEKVHANPEVDTLEQAGLMMGVPAYTGDDAEAEYLFRFFDWLYKDRRSNVRGKGAIRINVKDFENVLSFNKIVKGYKKGRIGGVNTYRTDRREELHEMKTKRKKYVNNGEDSPSVITQILSMTFSVPQLVYRKQVTEDSYIELVVEQPKMKYEVYGNKVVDAGIWDEKLLIPVNYLVAREMNYAKKESVYHSSLHFIFNAKKTIKIKWYQRGAFKYVIMVIAIAVTIFTAGAGSPLGIALAAGAYGTVALLIIKSIVINLLVGMLIQEAAMYIVEELDIDIGVVLVVVAAVTAIYGTAMNANWTKYAVSAASNLGSAVQDQTMQKIDYYKSEQQEFELLASEKQKELEEIENLLQFYPLLDPRSFIGERPVMVPGESPDDLYNRTVHSGNPGILVFDYIESYVDIHTRLPTFNDIVGETLV